MNHDGWAILTLLYAWLKAAHLIFVIFWIAGLFMLPRYYIYHQEAEPGSAEEQRWIDRERKLRKIILGPAMILVWIFGFALAFAIDPWMQGWFITKLGLVVALSAYHGWMVAYGRKLASGVRPVSGKSLRLMNEVPGVIVVLVVVLVIVQPY